MKKLVSLLLAVLMLVAVATAATAEGDNWKIAILTGTATQGEEEFRAAEKADATVRRRPHHHRYLSGYLHGRNGNHHFQAGRFRFRPRRQGDRDVPGRSGRQGRL